MKRKLKDYTGAIADYDKAIKLNPDYVKAYNNRGLAKSSINDYNGACSDWYKAKELGDYDAIELINKYCQ